MKYIFIFTDFSLCLILTFIYSTIF